MSRKQKVVFTTLSISGIGILIGIILLLSGGFISSKDAVEPIPVWQPRSLSDIYDPFDDLDTDLNDYIWPTNSTTIMTSVFGEFRSTHFHAGIDISTRGQIGAPVFASRGGSIRQIGVSPFGYGKYIIMQHDDGYGTLYAHLDSFDDALEERVYEYQYEVGRYNVVMNFEPDEFVFNQGDIIARSGSTGSGPPHIHFEIRDRNNNPVNPKFSDEFSINDRTPPIFNRFAVLPVDVRAFVNDRITPVTMPAIAIRPGSYVLREPINIVGKIGFAVDVHDRNDDTWYRHGIYALEFFIEDSLMYSLRYDRLPIEHRHQVRLHYDNYLLSSGRGRFQKLFVEEGNILPLYARRKPGSGLIDTEDYPAGLYDFRVVAYDFSGNSSTLAGSLILGSSPVDSETRVIPRIDNHPLKSFTESTLQIESKIFRDMMIISVTHREKIDEPNPLIVRYGETINSVPFVAVGGFTHQGRLKLPHNPESKVEYMYVFRDTIYTHAETIYTIRPEKNGEMVLDDGNLIVSYDYGSAYYPLYFTFSRIEDEEEFYYSFNSTSSVLDKGIRFSIKLPEYLEPFDRTVVYTRNGSRWNTIGSVSFEESRIHTGVSRQMLNDLKVGIDTTEPTITDVIVDGNRNMRIRFKLSDNESGIDHASVSMHLDETLLISRYDPDLSMVIYRAPEPVAPGSYNLTITARDRAGNGTVYERTVLIR
jgi:murein DD-endopeptidase MepM/ murein hydrolase activator NlpD